MNNEHHEIQPKTIFQTIINTPLTDQDKEVLMFLYQPIIGANALCLYLTLLSEINSTTGQSDSLFHVDIITTTDMGIKQIMQARKKLEGIGLLDTFVKEDIELGFNYIYQLNHPETAIRFFKDEILSITLLNVVGQRKFNKLFEQFQPKEINLAGYENISADFKEIYLFNEEQVLSQQEFIQTIHHQLKKSRPKRELTVDSETFDWNFFLTQLTNFGIQLPEDEADFKKMVLLYHQSLGIDEFEMANLAAKSFDYYTNQINSQELKKQINQAFYPQKKQRKIDPFYKDMKLSEEEKSSYRYNSLKQMENFSDADIAVVMESEKFAPEIYLTMVKEACNLFPTNIEKYNVRFLVEHSKLPNSVINILIHFVIVIEKKTTFESEHASKIANDWAKEKICSPEEAIIYVKHRQKEKQTKMNTKKPFYKGKQQHIRKEILPDWVENPIKEKKLSKEKKAALDRQIQEFLNRGGES